MQAITYRAYGTPDVLKPTTVTQPVPGSGEVLVQVHAASLNQADLYLLPPHGGISRNRPIGHAEHSAWNITVFRDGWSMSCEMEVSHGKATRTW